MVVLLPKVLGIDSIYELPICLLIAVTLLSQAVSAPNGICVLHCCCGVIGLCCLCRVLHPTCHL
jgi:hypothetical protein